MRPGLEERFKEETAALSDTSIPYGVRLLRWNAILLFAVFFATARLSSNVFRVLLFWLPATAISSLGLGLLGWFAVLMLQMKRS